jgi:predicted HicB family RNase H-like nuclease
MKYKGYTGVVEFDEGSGVLFGRVVGLRDAITFQGDSVAEVTQAFHDSVDDYLEFCTMRGESPEKPYSGQFVLRIDPQLHRVISHAAEERGVSLNSLIEEELEAAFSREGLSGSEIESRPRRSSQRSASGRAAPTSASEKALSEVGQAKPGTGRAGKASKKRSGSKSSKS